MVSVVRLLPLERLNQIFGDPRVHTTSAPHYLRRSTVYRSDVDGLRAIAILSVLSFHAFPTVVPGGLIGVDVFFVISGFLISGIVFERLDNNHFSFAEFYSRRIKRIFPALLVLLTATLAVGWVFLLSNEYSNLGRNAAAGALFISNLVLWFDSGNYFDSSSAEKPLLHLWSLGIEEQFYILWPLVLWTIWRYRIRPLWVVGAIAAISFGLNVGSIDNSPIAAFYAPYTRFWELSLGAGLASLPFDRANAAEKLESVDRNIRSWLGALLILAGLIWITKERVFPGWWALLPATGAALIISAGSGAWLNRRILSTPVLVWIGVISFPLYLWHWPILSFAHLAGAELSVAGRLLAILLALVLAWLTYVLVEKPVRFGGHVRLKTIVLTLLMGAVAYFSYSCYKHDGFGQAPRFGSSLDSSDYIKARDAFHLDDDDFQSAKCVEFVGTRQIPFCQLSEGYRPSAALIGDSHAYVIFGFLEHHARQMGRGLVLLGGSGCPPLLGVERVDLKGCAGVMATTVDVVNSNRDITEVFITGRFAATLSATNFGGVTPTGYYGLTLNGRAEVTDREEIFEIGLRSIVASFMQNGKRVTILLDLPELDFDPKRCLEFRGNHSCLISRAVVDERQAAYTKLIHQVGSVYHYRVVDLKQAFCDRSHCSAKKGNHVLYADSHHLGVNGNVFLVKTGFRIFPSQ